MKSKKEYDEMLDKLKEKFKSEGNTIDVESLKKALEEKEGLKKNIVNK